MRCDLTSLYWMPGTRHWASVPPPPESRVPMRRVEFNNTNTFSFLPAPRDAFGSDATRYSLCGRESEARRGICISVLYDENRRQQQPLSNLDGSHRQQWEAQHPLLSTIHPSRTAPSRFLCSPRTLALKPLIETPLTPVPTESATVRHREELVRRVLFSLRFVASPFAIYLHVQLLPASDSLAIDFVAISLDISLSIYPTGTLVSCNFKQYLRPIPSIYLPAQAPTILPPPVC